jgi:uncharacterized protein YecE (DUF72 family)
VAARKDTRKEAKRARVRVGTSGYAYPEWRGTFYPKEMPASRFLEHYASVFDTVELNNTFYRLPTESAVAGWAAGVPEGFVYSLKASMRITHQKRLRDAGEPLERLWSVSAALGPKRGPVLFGLPPNFAKDVARLKDFLALLPPDGRSAFEFRHASWFTDDVYDVLRDAGVALCVADAEELSTPLVATASWGYVRLRRADYAEGDLRSWADRLVAQPWTEAFVYLKHEEAGRGAVMAQALRAMV